MTEHDPTATPVVDPESNAHTIATAMPQTLAVAVDTRGRVGPNGAAPNTPGALRVSIAMGAPGNFMRETKLAASRQGNAAGDMGPFPRVTTLDRIGVAHLHRSLGRALRLVGADPLPLEVDEVTPDDHPDYSGTGRLRLGRADDSDDLVLAIDIEGHGTREVYPGTRDAAALGWLLLRCAARDTALAGVRRLLGRQKDAR